MNTFFYLTTGNVIVRILSLVSSLHRRGTGDTIFISSHMLHKGDSIFIGWMKVIIFAHLLDKDDSIPKGLIKVIIFSHRLVRVDIISIGLIKIIIYLHMFDKGYSIFKYLIRMIVSSLNVANCQLQVAHLCFFILYQPLQMPLEKNPTDTLKRL